MGAVDHPMTNPKASTLGGCLGEFKSHEVVGIRLLQIWCANSDRTDHSEPFGRC